jgi:hypothetical protein
MSDATLESHLVLMRLRPIKDALRPSEWDQRKKKVLATAHRVIGETLSSDDAYTIHGDETCMIAFAKTTVAQAEATATEISDKIVRSLFGEIGATTFPLQPRVLAIRDLLHNVNAEDPDGLLHSLLTGHRAGVPTEAHTEQLDEPRKDAEKASRRRKLFELFEPERPAEVTHEYRSVWRVDDQMVNCFRYVPCLQKSPMERLVGYAVLGPTYSEPELVDLDIQSAENAIIDLKRAVDAGHDVKLSLPIHFETVGSNHGRSELMKILPVLPASFRQRISVTMDGIPEGIPEPRLHEVVGVLKPFSESRSVILDAFPNNARVLRGMLAKVRSVGMDTIYVRLPPDASHVDLKAVCAIIPQITSTGLKTGVFSLNNSDEVVELVLAGCSILGGPIFGGPFEELPEPYSAPLSRFENPGNKVRLPKFISC